MKCERYRNGRASAYQASRVSSVANGASPPGAARTRRTDAAGLGSAGVTKRMIPRGRSAAGGSAAELAVVPGHDASGMEAQQDSLGGLRTDVRAHFRRVGRGVRNAEILDGDGRTGGGHASQLMNDLDVALQHRAAQLGVGIAGLDLERGLGLALEIADLLRLRVRPRGDDAVVHDV